MYDVQASQNRASQSLTYSKDACAMSPTYLGALSDSLSRLRDIRNGLFAFGQMLEGAPSAEPKPEPNPAGLGQIISEISSTIGECHELLQRISAQF